MIDGEIVMNRRQRTFQVRHQAREKNGMRRASGDTKAIAAITTLAATIGIMAAPAGAQLKQAPPAVVPTQTKPAATTAAARPADDIVVIQSGKPIVSKTRGWQRFTDYINLKAGQDKAPLTLTFQNGSDVGSAFQQVRISLAGRVLATDKDFKNRTLALNMTGALGAGGTQLIIDAQGPLDANMNWNLTTKKVQVTQVAPTTVAPGDKVTISGKNFTQFAQVMIGKTAAKVDTANATQLQITVPAGVEGGKQNLIVTVGGVASQPQIITVKSAPTVSGIDTLSAPPGQPVTISGTGFSRTASENIVTFNGTPGSIVSASNSSLTVVIPEIAYPQWNVEVKVKTNGVESKGSTRINVQQRVIPNDGVPES